MAAVGGFAVGLQLAVQRPSGLNASGLIVDGRNSTRTLVRREIDQCSRRVREHDPSAMLQRERLRSRANRQLA